ncbi:hypothetical protein EK21DRAFT_90658 [Setomelanomma holmii]|uniref:Uncharacterized protein n=1 Tax=Setomelanomma holmii TaxID=210430 RepID=A0A9P4H7I3_9PLEO|nr:hypothetical protein EK21DRAFT_90658 [Setomelanomma holmii]
MKWQSNTHFAAQNYQMSYQYLKILIMLTTVRNKQVNPFTFRDPLTYLGSYNLTVEVLSSTALFKATKVVSKGTWALMMDFCVRLPNSGTAEHVYLVPTAVFASEHYSCDPLLVLARRINILSRPLTKPKPAGDKSMSNENQATIAQISSAAKKDKSIDTLTRNILPIQNLATGLVKTYLAYSRWSCARCPESELVTMHEPAHFRKADHGDEYL